MGMSEYKWYVLHVLTGSEEFVAKAIRDKIEKEGLEDEIKEVLVPTEQVMEIKEREKKVVTRKSYPGYVFVKMKLNDRTKVLVRNIPKVAGFVGASGEPTPLREEEVKRMIEHMESTSKKPRPKYKFEKGEPVRIIDGPFINFNGIIEEVDEEKQKLKVIVTIFGRSTPVELEFLQVEKISS